jgi:hypothetical protein
MRDTETSGCPFNMSISNHPQDPIKRHAETGAIDLMGEPNRKRRRTINWQPLSQDSSFVHDIKLMLLQLLDQQPLRCSIPGDEGRDLSELARLSLGDAAVLAMEKHPSSLRVQIEGCSVLRHHIKAVGTTDSRGLCVVVTALDVSTDPLIHYLAVDCLRLASGDANCRMMIAAHSHCIRTLVETIQSSPTNARLQELGLSTFSYLVEEPGCRRQLIEEGGIDVIISAMKTHASNSLIQCNGSAALCWLVHQEHEDAKEAITGNPDAIPTIYGTSETFIDNASVFGNCMCILFGALVGDGSVLLDYPLLGEPTRRLIQLGMRKHPNVVKLQRNCMMLLVIVTENAAIDEEAMQSYDDCIGVLLCSMKAFPKEVDIQYLACRILANLAANSKIKQRIVATPPCITQVTSAVLEHQSDKRLQRGALHFVNELLTPRSDEESRQTVDAGILSVLKHIMGLADIHCTV